MGNSRGEIKYPPKIIFLNRRRSATGHTDDSRARIALEIVCFSPIALVRTSNLASRRARATISYRPRTPFSMWSCQRTGIQSLPWSPTINP